MIFKQKKSLSLALLLVAAHASFNTVKTATLDQEPDIYFEEQIPNLEERINYLFRIFLTDTSVKLPLRWFFDRLIFVINQNTLEIKKRALGIKGSDKDKFIEEFIKVLTQYKECIETNKGTAIGYALAKYLDLLPKESKTLISKIGPFDLRKMIQYRIRLNVDENAAY